MFLDAGLMQYRQSLALAHTTNDRCMSPVLNPEAQARENIDRLLIAAGWHVCDMTDANMHAAKGVAIREFPLESGYGFADYLLYIDGKAAGIIEAKKEGKTT
jgi:type I restriction enzyme R subunit